MRVLAALGLALGAPLAAALVAIPPVARVTDLTGTLEASQRGALEQRLAAFEQRKGSQIAVLVVPTTQPEEIEQYAIRVFDAWKLGRKGVDDGILVVVAKNDRRLRIEVGYGLEGAVPDAIANRIIDEIITPRFRDGDFYGGISAGVDQLMHVIDGEPLPEPRRSREQPEGDTLGLVMGAGLFLLGFGNVAGRLIGKVPAALGAGVVGGLFAALMTGSVVVGAVLGVIAFLVILASLFAKAGSRSGRGGWGNIHIGGGGFGRGGGFGGGGFGGGGGRSGGGGASGGW